MNTSNSQPYIFSEWLNVTSEKGKFYLDEKYEADYFIEAIGGLEYLGNETTSPLIQSLFDNKLTEIHPIAGITVDAFSFALTYNNIIVNSIFSLGPLNSGTLFATNAFWFNTKCAYLLARSICYNLEKEKVVE